MIGRATRTAVLCAVVAGLVLLGLPASAGIIITSGKVADGASNIAASNSLCSNIESKRPTKPATHNEKCSGDGTTTAGPHGTPPESGLHNEAGDGSLQAPGDLDDLDTDPAGYDCTVLASGVEYCEPEADEAHGGSPGAGAGGGLGATSEDGAWEGETAGCSGGGLGGGLLPLLLAWLPLLAVRRRRD